MNQLRFLFKLRELDDIVPWGTAENRTLSWFGLSDGAYCIETGAGKLLEYRNSVAEDIGDSWCDYQVARLFEDLIEVFPIAWDPVPEDIVALHSEWLSMTESLRSSRIVDQDLVEGATYWWHERRLNYGYLSTHWDLRFWRVGSQMHLLWKTDQSVSTPFPWKVQDANLKFSVDVFWDAVLVFFRDFLGAMERRVSLIQEQGLPHKDCAIDISRLVAEQRERTVWAANALQRTKDTNWDSVRHCLQRLMRP